MMTKKDGIGLLDQNAVYKVSVIVPVFNGEAHITQLLNELIAHTLDSLEIICVDDGSTDGTLAILNDYSANHENVIVLHGPNQGAYRARMRGISMARGECIGFCDVDDRPLPIMFQRLYESIREHGTSMAVCGFERIREGSVVTRESLGFRTLAMPVDCSSGWLVTVNTALWNKLFRAEVLRGLFQLQDPPRIMEDALMLFSVYPRMEGVSFVDEALYRYSFSSESAMGHLDSSETQGLVDAWVATRSHIKVAASSYLPLFDLGAFVHLGISGSLSVMSGSKGDGREALKLLKSALASSFPCIHGNRFLSSGYVHEYPAIRKVKLAYGAYRCGMLAPLLKVYGWLNVKGLRSAW